MEGLNGASDIYSRSTDEIAYQLHSGAHFDERIKIVPEDYDVDGKHFVLMAAYFDVNRTHLDKCWSLYDGQYNEMNVIVSGNGDLVNGFSTDSHSVMLLTRHDPPINTCEPYAFICKTQADKFYRLPEDRRYYMGTEWIDWPWTDFEANWNLKCKENHYFNNGQQWIVNGDPKLDKCDIWYYQHADYSECLGCHKIPKLDCWEDCIRSDFDAVTCSVCDSIVAQSYGNEHCTDPPTYAPTQYPSNQPSNPSLTPTNIPTINPSFGPSQSPSKAPSNRPSEGPSFSPSMDPTSGPTTAPTLNPKNGPTPTEIPTRSPFTPRSPSFGPTEDRPEPSKSPSTDPTISPSNAPSTSTTDNPSNVPSTIPTDNPTISPFLIPTNMPTKDPTTANPYKEPSGDPTMSPKTMNPSVSPSLNPSESLLAPGQTSYPSNDPSITPTDFSSKDPAADPTFEPISPSINPSIDNVTPSKQPLIFEQTLDTTATPTSEPIHSITLSTLLSTAIPLIPIDEQDSQYADSSEMDELLGTTVGIITFVAALLISLCVVLLPTWCWFRRKRKSKKMRDAVNSTLQGTMQHQAIIAKASITERPSIVKVDDKDGVRVEPVDTTPTMASKTEEYDNHFATQCIAEIASEDGICKYYDNEDGDGDYEYYYEYGDETGGAGVANDEYEYYEE